MLRNNPRAARLLPRLLYQFVPAAVVSTVGVLLLSNLAKAPDAPPPAMPVETAIPAESVFRIVPREMSADAEPDAKRVKGAPSRAGTNTKPPAVTAAAPQSRKVASLPAPLPITPTVEPQQTVAATNDENAIISTLRSATTAVRKIPQWAGRAVTGWFAEDTPPRPPASVPAQNFQAAM